jgi:hypothetical protein
MANLSIMWAVGHFLMTVHGLDMLSSQAERQFTPVGAVLAKHAADPLLRRM